MTAGLVPLLLVAAVIQQAGVSKEDGGLRALADQLKAKVFPDAKLAILGADVKFADYMPTAMLSVPDGGERAKRLEPKTTRSKNAKRGETADDYLRRAFDTLATNNWENRVYVSALPDEATAKLFVDAKDGIAGGDIRAFRLGTYAVWGDKKHIEKANKVWFAKSP